jgi:phosphoglycerol transferase MdoB-like AlkP superfamily enzyme
MSVDAHWFSTMFGVYFFASCVQCVHITLILALMWIQSKGRLAKSVTTEHYHDLGKMLFAFTVFWAYVAFSQFMLIWYANLPEETAWFKDRFAGGWGSVSWTLLFGHFVIPFFGLLSRHIKRNKKALAFWCVWQLAMVFVDMYWLVLPAIDVEPSLRAMDLLALLGLLSALVAGAAREAGRRNLIPTKDPRLEHSLAFENI